MICSSCWREILKILFIAKSAQQIEFCMRSISRSQEVRAVIEAPLNGARAAAFVGAQQKAVVKREADGTHGALMQVLAEKLVLKSKNWSWTELSCLPTHRLLDLSGLNTISKCAWFQIFRLLSKRLYYVGKESFKSVCCQSYSVSSWFIKLSEYFERSGQYN